VQVEGRYDDRFRLSQKLERTQSTGPLRVTIIGAGFSGTMAAVHLLRQDLPVRIELVDRRVPGRGLAYSTAYEEHLLNVPAIRMSAFGDDPGHFLDWLRSHGRPDADPHMFAPRKLYGAYIQDTLETTAEAAGASSGIQHHFTYASKLDFDGVSVSVQLENGRRLQADRVILATGNPAPRSVAEQSPRYFSSPWAANALAHVPAEKDVLLIGAGLTAVDALIALLSRGHTGRVHMVSRRGKLPRAHTSYRTLPVPVELPGQPTARSLVRAVRQHAQKAQAQGMDWRAVLDSIRPITNEVWQKLLPRDQLRILRHAKTWWDIHRHRMAPEIGVQVDDAVASKRLLVHSGRLKRIRETNSGLDAEISLRSGQILTLAVDRVINCTGPDADYRQTENSFIRSLQNSGFAEAGAIGKGLRTTEQGELLAANGRPLEWLLALGPPRFGDLFETIAVPELRRQAEALANHLFSIGREPVEVMPDLFIAAGI